MNTTNIWDDEDEEDDQPALAVTPPFLGLSFDGRYGRLNFVNATSLFFVSFIIFTMVTSFIPFSFILTAAFFIAPVYFFVRHLSLRLHDLNLPSIVSLLIWVPYVNILFLIALLVIPGKKGSNDYGPPSEQGPIWGLLGLGAVSIVVIWVYVTFVSAFMALYNAAEEYEKNRLPADEVILVAKPFTEYLLNGKYSDAIALTSAKYQTLNLSSTLEANFDAFKFSNKISKLTLNEAESDYEHYYSFDNNEKVQFGGVWVVLDGESKDYRSAQAVISLLVIKENGALKIHDVDFNESYYGDYDDDDYDD